MLQKYRTDHAHINGQRVVTAMLPSGRFVAFFTETDELRGYGHSRLSAIEDLTERHDELLEQNAEPPLD